MNEISFETAYNLLFIINPKQAKFIKNEHEKVNAKYFDGGHCVVRKIYDGKGNERGTLYLG
jgi:hypothetical protein